MEVDFSKAQQHTISSLLPTNTNFDVGSHILPVTIKQLLDAVEQTPSSFFMHERKLSKVSLAARISSMKNTSTNIKFNVEDGTGALEIKLWRDEEGRNNAPSVRENMYISIVGSLLAFNGQRYVSADSIREVRDFNQVSFQILHAVHAHLLYVHHKSLPGAASVDSDLSDAAAKKIDDGYDRNISNQQAQTFMDVSALVKDIQPPFRMGDTVMRVLDTIKTKSDRHGSCFIPHIAKDLGIRMIDVFKAVDELHDRFLVYNPTSDPEYIAYTGF